MKAPDWNRTAEDYARHRAGFPDWFFERAAAHGLFSATSRILDLGTGTGYLARGFARRGASVTGLDLAPGMMAAAKDLDSQAGVTIDYKVAPAEDTGFAAASFDLVSAGTCWHWFDKARVAAEAARVLKPGRHLFICNLFWLPVLGNIVAETEALIEAHNPNWDLGGWHGHGAHELLGLIAAGYENRESFSVDFDIPYSPNAWRGRIRASAGVSASLGAAEVEKFDADLAGLLAKKYPADIIQVPHRIVAVWGKTPGESA